MRYPFRQHLSAQEHHSPVAHCAGLTRTYKPTDLNRVPLQPVADGSAGTSVVPKSIITPDMGRIWFHVASSTALGLHPAFRLKEMS